MQLFHVSANRKSVVSPLRTMPPRYVRKVDLCREICAVQGSNSFLGLVKMGVLS